MSESHSVLRRIRIEGLVQGVGFRPFTAVTAAACGISGYVRNAGGAVDILASGPAVMMDKFEKQLRESPPAGSLIVHFSSEHVDVSGFPAIRPSEFHIIESIGDDDALRMPAPDVALCPDCAEELFDRGNRRYLHPFISCTRCGPRYSILADLPYDRRSTSMADFPMCPCCEAEYRSETDRRFHSQTSACPECGPTLVWHGTRAGKNCITRLSPGLKMPEPDTSKTGPQADAWLADAPEEIQKATACIAGGGIVAVKGIGGYHLVCTPFNESVVQRLRTIKQRDQKPFAILYPDLEAIRQHAEPSPDEVRLLESPSAPIVLLRAIDPKPFPESVLRGSPDIGAFLPATPIQLMLVRALGPLIATSANRSDDPILAEDADMLAFACETGLDGVLANNRRILVPQDDSVLAMAAGRRLTLRRGRGIAPLALPFHAVDVDPNTSSVNRSDTAIRMYPGEIATRVNPLDTAHLEDHAGTAVARMNSNSLEKNAAQHLMAVGADMKASWCLVRDGLAYTGEYLGDRMSAHADARWTRSMEHMRRSLALRPGPVACDLHPGYVSTHAAEQLCAGSGSKMIRFQHHHAHILSVLAEHGMRSRVIGLAFDGTGYGLDGTIWGSEVLVIDGHAFQRAAHLHPIRMPGGDRASRDGLLCAWSMLQAFQIDWPEHLPEPDGRMLLEAALAQNALVHVTTSMGRLFDAVSALLGICLKSRYEGEAAILLEQAARRALDRGWQGAPLPISIIPAVDGTRRIVLDQALSLIVKSVPTEEGACRLALGFHEALADAVHLLVSEISSETGIRTVAASGGVFQNRLLLLRIIDKLEQDGYTVLVNRDVPPNDAGVALGQAFGLHLMGG